jgi:hypothetical protein
MIEPVNFHIDGHVKIWDPLTKEVFVDKHNAINPETMSIVTANMLSGNKNMYIYEMHFGNGGVVIDETGNITYKDVTTNMNNGTVAALYNPTYFKIVDNDPFIDPVLNPDTSRNKMEVVHTQGLNYSDLVITCTLEESEPNLTSLGNIYSKEQLAMDNAPDFTGEFVFNELGLKSKGSAPNTNNYLLSHIVFHPVQKSANRVIQVVYTLRIRVT